MEPPEISSIMVKGRRIATRVRPGKEATLLFLPGYASDMEGTKALALDAFAAERGLAMARLDYSGTGSSSGEFAAATLDRWIAEALAVLDRLTSGPVILVGSSMGGWIALHLALKRPQRIAGLVGIASAPDFTQWGFTVSEKQQIAREGLLERPTPYGPEPAQFHRDFWESGQELRLLEGPIAIDCPVRLVHGDGDQEVPLDVSSQLMRRLHSDNVQLLTIKGGGHRLSEPREIAALLATVQSLLEPET